MSDNPLSRFHTTWKKSLGLPPASSPSLKSANKSYQLVTTIIDQPRQQRKTYWNVINIIDGLKSTLDSLRLVVEDTKDTRVTQLKRTIAGSLEPCNDALQKLARKLGVQNEGDIAAGKFSPSSQELRNNLYNLFYILAFRFPDDENSGQSE